MIGEGGKKKALKRGFSWKKKNNAQKPYYGEECPHRSLAGKSIRSGGGSEGICNVGEMGNSRGKNLLWSARKKEFNTMPAR